MATKSFTELQELLGAAWAAGRMAPLRRPSLLDQFEAYMERRYGNAPYHLHAGLPRWMNELLNESIAPRPWPGFSTEVPAPTIEEFIGSALAERFNDDFRWGFRVPFSGCGISVMLYTQRHAAFSELEFTISETVNSSVWSRWVLVSGVLADLSPDYVGRYPAAVAARALGRKIAAVIADELWRKQAREYWLALAENLGWQCRDESVEGWMVMRDFLAEGDIDPELLRNYYPV